MHSLITALLKAGLITQEQLEDARDKQKGAKKPLQDVLVDMGFVTEADLLDVSSKIFNMPVMELDDSAIDPSAMKLISYETAKRHGVFPVRSEDSKLIVAMSNPQDIVALDDLRIISNMHIKPVLSKKSDIAECIEKYYRIDDSVYDILKNITDEADVEIIGESKKEEDTQAALDIKAFENENTPIVRLVNLVLGDAVKGRASDIHIEPRDRIVEIRYRIDGDLKSIMTVPRNLHPTIVARIKILASLDIAETRMSQDGRTHILVNGRKIDLRVSVVPTFYGERVVLRLLDAKEAKVDMGNLGFQNDELAVFKEAIRRPQGIILVTGPTGSGKTSTLYAALNEVKSEIKNIMTIEDPIEYLVPGINQMQINPVKDVTFAMGLRSILRQDPNIILVGEIRDRDTAEIAFRASLTGHLVFSTLHTNNATSTVTRLLDIGLEPYLIASSVIMIVAQRLVKVICPHCKEEVPPDQKMVEKFKIYIDRLGIKKFYIGKGCEKCDFTGFYGRTAIFEIMKISVALRDLIDKRAPESAIFNEARKSGMKTLAESGIEKVAQGLTTLREVAKIADVVEEIIPAGSAASPAAEAKILVVDDEEDILKVLDKRLESAGYRMIGARDGREAIQCTIKEKPDLIIMDVMMPQMDGFEAVKTLRSRLETARIPIIMLTAKHDKESEVKGLDMGADDYITKPFDSDKLLARIRMLLKRRGGAENGI
jgi:type IV pilus assembly protein PilB